MKRIFLCAALAATAVFGATANADSLAAPGFYNGTGGINDGFTVVDNNGIELGLRAQNRFPTPANPNVITPVGNTYAVAGGFHDATHANWNYDFSINLMSTGLHLSDITAILTVTDLTASGQPFTSVSLYGPFGSYFGDNAGYNGTTTHANAVGSDIGAQNSQNPAFGNFPLNSVAANYFSAHAFDTYEFTLDVSKTGVNGGNSTPLASDTINVAATPLPATVWQGAALLGGLGVFAAAKRRQSVPAL